MPITSRRLAVFSILVDNHQIAVLRDVISTAQAVAFYDSHAADTLDERTKAAQKHNDLSYILHRVNGAICKMEGLQSLPSKKTRIRRPKDET